VTGVQTCALPILAMDDQDRRRYPCIDQWRENRERLKRNLNQVM
jgi:hypothetical protein